MLVIYSDYLTAYNVQELHKGSLNIIGRRSNLIKKLLVVYSKKIFND